mmetsp:Transcript_21259/g.31152  ORF Transcript_21259/g.31152 Transcript_21259/m.31152 type:complete len:251 (+) Transcript_21259:1693-2445(+)
MRYHPTLTLFCSNQQLPRDALSGCHPNHQLDQINTGNHFRDGMLHLQTGVHLQKIKILLLIHQKLDRTSTLVTSRMDQIMALAYHLPSGVCVEQRARTLLQYLLIPTLHAAFALGEAQHLQLPACLVFTGQNLYLDVMRPLYVLLDEQTLVVEKVFSFGRAQSKPLSGIAVGVTYSHTLSSTTRRGLDHDWISHPIGDSHRLLLVGDDSLVSWNGVDAGILRDSFGCDFIAHIPDCRFARAHEFAIVDGG